ncbi:MAG: hypothetical protein WC796_05020 [Candidatus Pacearchaeota archaeon]|jgi:hypothetical protein
MKEDLNDTETNEERAEKPKKVDTKLERVQLDKLKGRVIIINPENSEFAKNLNLSKKGDYTQKTK